MKWLVSYVDKVGTKRTRIVKAKCKGNIAIDWYSRGSGKITRIVKYNGPKKAFGE